MLFVPARVELRCRGRWELCGCGSRAAAPGVPYSPSRAVVLRAHFCCVRRFALYGYLVLCALVLLLLLALCVFLFASTLCLRVSACVTLRVFGALLGIALCGWLDEYP